MIAQSPIDLTPDSPGFAPNAFPDISPQQSTSYQQAPHWYDRILDVLLGEDETAAKNRLVLLCSQCRLVNGQAPPGVRTLEELGRWRCSGCGAWNGAETEGTKVVKEITGVSKSDSGEGWENVPRASEIKEDPDEDAEDVHAEGIAGSGIEGATGREGGQSSITKRVTRSTGQDGSLEALE